MKYYEVKIDRVKWRYGQFHNIWWRLQCPALNNGQSKQKITKEMECSKKQYNTHVQYFIQNQHTEYSPGQTI